MFKRRKPSSALDVDRARLTALVTLELVADALFLLQGRHTGAFDGADMNEGVFTTAFWCDEAVTLLLVEKFHCAGWHNQFLLFGTTAYRPTGARRSEEKE